MRPRSEVFFVPLNSPYVDVYLPKQAALKVRPVRRVVVYQRNDIKDEPYFGAAIADATELPAVTITLRDENDAELIKDAPVWMFGESVQFAKLGPYTPIMHGKRDLADLLVDPQRTSLRLNDKSLTGITIALEFVYSA